MFVRLIDRKTVDVATAPRLGRRQFLTVLFSVLTAANAYADDKRRYRVAFANINDDPTAHVLGLGFTGADVRRGFELAARTLPLDITYYDNGGNPDTAVANADEAVAHKAQLFIEFNADPDANAEIGRKLRAAGIPVLAVGYPVPDAPFYGPDNVAAGRIAGSTLADYARQNWTDQTVLAVIAGDFGDPASYMAERVRGITEGLRKSLPKVPVTQLDTSGNPVRVDGLLRKFLLMQTRSKVLIATLDDPTALYAKEAIERAVRGGDCVIVSQGLDNTIHGGANDKKEIDPNNSGSIVLGSVAYYLDRYGDEVLPLALKMLEGTPVPAQTLTHHILVSSANIFIEYPPTDIN